jgi:hypothetical protein
MVAALSPEFDVGRVVEVGPGSATPLDSLRSWSATHLDTRGGRERQESEPMEFSDQERETILRAAGPLGLLATAFPTRLSYDLTIVLGGTVLANELRLQLAWRLADVGVDLGRLVAASAYRPLSASERDRALESGAPENARESEYSHLEWVVRRHVGEPTRSRRREGGSGIYAAWSYTTFSNEASSQIEVAKAPSRRPNRRADTLDVVRFVGQMVGTTPHAVLVVTSAIYAPYTFFLLAPTATSGHMLEVVGTPTSVNATSALTQRLAQEMHATLSVMAD